ncbi:MAG: phosphoglucomutase/phosphomannomutase alpha/beta/alpha domain [Firmicutes bacterium]|nr:phosphoglucomutase/phosphomannomutase alpha/beta/alpha domain [Bacillota bacterium]
MSIYHACDIRGIAGQDLSDIAARQIALAVGYKLAGEKVVVGGDVRISTPRLIKIVIDALIESGCQVIDIGTVASPIFYYALKTTAAKGGIMVTASHNPAPYNGFKLVFGDKPVSEEDVQEIARLVEAGTRVSGQGEVKHLPVVEDYLAFTSALSKRQTLKVVIDAGNGATSTIAPRLFKKLGYEVIELNCTPDGDFPNHPPNPALAENLVQLGQKVREAGADLGVAFDGDGDRVGFVDEQGRPVDNDDIMVLLARYYLEQGPGTIIYDAKCSMVAPEEIVKAGGRAVMARAGHTFSKKAFLEEKALFAGEISGHFFFRELGYDDGMFGALKVCEFVAEHRSLAMLIDAIPNYLLTPDIRVADLGYDKTSVLNEVAKKLASYKLNLIDGVRVEFEDGWAMIRASVTEPLFTLRFEAKTPERLHDISGVLLEALPEDIRQAVVSKMPLN